MEAAASGLADCSWSVAATGPHAHRRREIPSLGLPVDDALDSRHQPPVRRLPVADALREVVRGVGEHDLAQRLGHHLKGRRGLSRRRCREHDAALFGPQQQELVLDRHAVPDGSGDPQHEATCGRHPLLIDLHLALLELPAPGQPHQRGQVRRRRRLGGGGSGESSNEEHGTERGSSCPESPPGVCPVCPDQASGLAMAAAPLEAPVQCPYHDRRRSDANDDMDDVALLAASPPAPRSRAGRGAGRSGCRTSPRAATPTPAPLGSRRPSSASRSRGGWRSAPWRSVPSRTVSRPLTGPLAARESRSP